jgi:hypothetical protein
MAEHGNPRWYRESGSLGLFKTHSRAGAMIWIKGGLRTRAGLSFNTKRADIHAPSVGVSSLMPRIFPAAVALALSLSLSLSPAALAAPLHKKPAAKHGVTRHWHGYGFLPGYRPPEVVERERAEHYWRSAPRFYGPAWPRFYHGRWNGGGFGPCYTYTPIGYMWNCGQ